MTTTADTFTITSAEELPRELAPADYLPAMSSGPMIYDDELDSLPESMGWRIFFNGGGNGLYFVRTNIYGTPYVIEQTGMGGPYSVYSEWDSDTFANAYDAFYWADEICGPAKDEDEPADVQIERAMASNHETHYGAIRNDGAYTLCGIGGYTTKQSQEVTCTNCRNRRAILLQYEYVARETQHP